MKQKILAVVIPSLLTVSGTANALEVYNEGGNKLDLYGKASGVRYISRESKDDGDKSYINFGFKGETRINEDISGYGQWEYKILANGSEDINEINHNKTILGIAGLKLGNMGSIDYGRNYGIIYNITSWSHKNPEFGGIAIRSDNFMQGRGSGFLTYNNTNFFGLVNGWDFAIQYQGQNNRPNLLLSNGHGYGISTSYNIPMGVGIAAAYSNSTFSSNQMMNHNRSVVMPMKRGHTWATALKYDTDKFYLAATYSHTINEIPLTSKTITTKIPAIKPASDIPSDTSPHSSPNSSSSFIFSKTKKKIPYIPTFAKRGSTFEIVAQYKFDFGLSPSISYSETTIGGIATEKYISLGATYSFNKKLTTYFNYKIDPMYSPGNIVAVGLVYQF
ncbi:porin OmpC [Pantoea sp. Aalb]|nr:porin OmpC [Pantoea sp. Aalb]